MKLPAAVGCTPGEPAANGSARRGEKKKARNNMASRRGAVASGGVPATLRAEQTAKRSERDECRYCLQSASRRRQLRPPPGELIVGKKSSMIFILLK